MTTNEIEDALALLGRNRRQVAINLRKCGITGHTEDGGRCPIANYLRRTLHAQQVEVDYTYIYVDGITFTLPPHIDAFVTAFDKGDYPDLEASNVNATGN